MTADHLFPILESEVDSGMLVQVASRLADGDIPEEVVDGIRLGRLTALAKPDGGEGEVETDFGQTDFGHRYPTDFGQTDFGQTDFDLCLCVCLCVLVWRGKRRGAQMCTFGVLWLSCEAPAARSGGAAGVPHDSARAQTCTFEGPGLQKHHQNSTRRHPEREEKNKFCGGRGKKRANFWAVQGKGCPAEGGPGKGGPGKGGPGKGGPGKGGPGKGGPRKGGPGRAVGKGGSGGTEHDQTKTLKPSHGNRETNTHATQAHTNTHTNTSRSRFGQSRFGQSRFGQSRFWPKSVLAKVGHTTKTLTLAKVGLAKVGHQ